MNETKFCVYLTVSKELNKFYIGRSLTSRVLNGYQGSGVKIKNYLKKHKDKFVTFIIQDGLTTQEADALEAELVPKELLSIEGCLNLNPGGGSPGWASKYSTKEIGPRIAQRKKEEFAKDPEKKAMQKERFVQIGVDYQSASFKEGCVVSGVRIPNVKAKDLQRLLKPFRIHLRNAGYRKEFIGDDKGTYLDGVRFLWQQEMFNQHPKHTVVELLPGIFCTKIDDEALAIQHYTAGITKALEARKNVGNLALHCLKGINTSDASSIVTKGTDK